jgi:hypothetical protein
MRLIKSFLFIAALASFSFITNERSAFQPWQFIGDRKVNFLIDRDVIHVSGNDNYRQIKLKVTDGPVHILDMDIYFKNGDKFDVSIRNRIPQGGESRVIDLPGGSRSIKKIEFWYETKGFKKGRARVAVWGRR